MQTETAKQVSSVDEHGETRVDRDLTARKMAELYAAVVKRLREASVKFPVSKE